MKWWQILIGIILWAGFAFGMWVGFAQFAVHFLPEEFWIPMACLGMLLGIGVPLALASAEE